MRPTAAVAAPVLIPHRLPRVATTTPMLRTPPPPPRQERPVGLVTGLGIVLSPPEPAVEAPPVQLTQRRHGHAGSVDPQRAEAALRAAAALAALVTPAGISGVTPEQPPMPEQPPRPEPTPRAARPHPTPAASLLTAEPRYLGEPRVPATPYRAPGWLRAAQAMLGLPDDPLGLPPPPPPPPPQLPRAATQPASRPSAGQLARGRPVPTLRTGPPRRPGLGAPLPQPSLQPHPDPPGPAGPRGADPRGWGISPVEPSERHIVAEKGGRAERVPGELVTAFRGSHGVDVSDVPVHRGDEAARRAQDIQAGAFTSGGEVFLPAEAGPLTETAARAMLAHELAHVVQQRTLGSALPDEHTAHGRDLEAQARAHEEWARHGAVGAPPVSLRATAPAEHAPSAPMIHPKVQRTPRSTTADAPASPAPAPAPAPASPPASPPDGATPSSSSASSSGSSGLTGSDAPRLVGGVRLPDESWTQQHDSGNPRNAGELGNMFAESFGGLVLDEWGIDSSVPGADLERDTRRTQLRTQLLEEINHERVRQHMSLLAELGADELQLVEDQLDHERHTAQGLTGDGRGSGGTGGRTGTGTTGGTGTATGTGRGSASSSSSPDDGRIHNFREFGGELALGAIDLLGGGMGIDLTADQENEIRGRPARATDSTSASGAAHTEHPTGTAHATGGEHELIEPDRMDLDELAVRIYDRLRSRLRLELLVDRERAGLLSDFR